MKITVTFIVTFIGLLCTTSWADTIQLGLPIYGGTGCPQGSASAVLSPDAKSLSVLFDSYQAQAGASANKAMDRKSCNIAIPVHVPQGLSVSIIEADYRGFNSLPSGAYSMLTAQYFFAGSQGPTTRKTFIGPLEKDYEMISNLEADALVWSPCGADVNLRANTSMFVKSNLDMEDALSTVDSVDVKSSIIYSLQWRTCR